MTNAEQANSLFMVKSSSRLLVELLSRGIAHAADSQQSLIQLAHKLLLIAEASYVRRDFQKVKEASELLPAMPLHQAQSAGYWYKAITERREGRIIEAAQRLNHLLTDHRAVPRFRARALQTLGTIQYRSGHFEDARQLYIESSRYISRESSQDVYTFSYSVILHNQVLADEGNTGQALRQLLTIEPIISKINNSLLTATYCNNIAVDLLELGKVKEAALYSRVACQSPLAYAYPEWRETALEIEQRTIQRNIVAVAVSPEPRKRPAQPEYLLIVLQFSPRVTLKRPVTVRQRVTCKNPTAALVALVAQIRAPSF